MTDAIDLREIERWLDWPELEWSRFGPMCVRLLRALTEVGVPEDAMPPREPGEPVAPVGRVPRTDPPVY